MYFLGKPIVEIDQIDTVILDNIILQIQENFLDQFSNRTTAPQLQQGTTLKIISPGKADLLEAVTAVKLKELIFPVVEKYLSSNEMIGYLDISSYGPGTRTAAHLDLLWLHLMSKRIHIPLITNNKCRTAYLSDNGIEIYHMEKGKVYAFNNEIMHVAANFGEADRWHILVDIIDKKLFDFLNSKNLLAEPFIDPSSMHCSDPVLVQYMIDALKGLPVDQEKIIHQIKQATIGVYPFESCY